MIFEWLKPFTQSKIFQPTSFFGESNGSVGLATRAYTREAAIIPNKHSII